MKNPHENYGHSMTNNILISIYPRYMEKIINKQKNFEFRNFYLTSDPYNIFWIYETIPTKALKYKLIVKNPITKLKKNQHYFLGDDKFEQLVQKGKYAYEIIHLEEILLPISLSNLKNLGVTAPQGYAYIKKYPSLVDILEKVELKRIF